MSGPPHPRQPVLRREVEAWQGQRNREAARVDWHFTTEDARIKLKSLYPSIQHLACCERCWEGSRGAAALPAYHGLQVVGTPDHP